LFWENELNFLVTGAAGFLGSNLANNLVKTGHQVRGLDDLSTGDPARLNPSVLFTRGDVQDRPKLWTLLQDVECVYHLAARVSVQESVLYPREYNLVNVGGTVSMMEAMRDVGVRRVVFISSGAVYGEQKTQPVAEGATPNPDSPYAVSKLSAEYYVRTIGALWGIETVILRVFNAYGPGQPLPAAHAPVVARFLRQAAGGGSLVVHNGGTQTRDYVYIDDAVECMTAASTMPDVDRKVINVGSGSETSVQSLADQIIRLVRQGEVLKTPYEEGGVSHLCADITLARDLLGYRPRISLAEGLRLTYERDPRFQTVPVS
jgi:UDP-glucose 4-epimerase